ncbi:Gdb1p [Cryptosporidium ryanae]|uniref:Gdb1p n=1 Tax=Cryptosporidium ryanae TaxID=515981 RepID=UPI00351A3DEB|nr:Gdb1p [Cryptosporidium ryanae]
MSSIISSLGFRNQGKSNEKKSDSAAKIVVNAKDDLVETIKLLPEETGSSLNREENEEINFRKECILTETKTLESLKNNELGPVNSNWFGEFSKDGLISCIGTNGNIRILSGDIILLKLYNGLIKGVGFSLKIEFFSGESSLMCPTYTDSLGNHYWTVKMEHPGSVKVSIHVTKGFFDDNVSLDELNSNLKHNFIIVEPKLYINNIFLPSSGICMQTLLSQCLGNIKNWKRRLEITSKLNYNMVHFTPLQTFGQSGSCYSIANQNEISSLFFKSEDEVEKRGEDNANLTSKEYTKKEKYEFVRKVIYELESDYGILSTCDIVLNHSADNSPWLVDHPESGYNIDNSPHLRAAVELDLRLQEFSRDVVNGKYASKYGVDRNITTTSHVDLLIQCLRSEVLIPFNMREYFKLDKSEIISNLKNSESGSETKEDEFLEDIIERLEINEGSSFEDRLYNVIIHFVCRFRNKGISVPGYVFRKAKINRVEGNLTEILDRIQNRLYSFAEDIVNNICDSVRGLIVWERVECSKGPIGLNHWEALTPRYFTPIKDKHGRTQYLANNGWVMGWNAKKDFASSGSFVYLKRDLIVWSDCVKLRYGRKESDSPFLWKWMADYCRSVAEVFHGIRLDNCHSTPLHVAKHMLRECRKVRPNIWVYAELFTGDYQVDLEFERVLGLNALIREAMRSESPGSLGYSVSNYSTAPIGGLTTVPSMYQEVNVDKDKNEKGNSSLPPVDGFKPLKKFSCPAIFFDCTHDNETPCEIRTPIDTLPTAALVASANCALGSTRGFDELVPHNISVVSERRLYQNYILNINGDGMASSKNENRKKDISLRSRSNSLGPFERLASNYLSEVSTINWGGEGSSTNNTNISTEINIEWRHPATNVEIRGDWDNWKDGIKLEKHPNGNFVTKLYIRFGKKDQNDVHLANQEARSVNVIFPTNNRLQFEYKYIVDGNWVHDPNLPYTSDDNGNINNIVTLLKRQRSIASLSKWKHGDKLPGIMGARKTLNKLHQRMSINGFSESHVHYLTQDIIMVQRYNPKIQENIYFITHSSFNMDKTDQLPDVVVLDGCIKDTIFAGTLHVPNYTLKYINDSDRIHGIDSELHKYKNLEEISCVKYDEIGNQTTLKLKHFPPGSLLILHTIKHKGYSITQHVFDEFYNNIATVLPGIMSRFLYSDKCHPSDAINFILFSCNNEELDRSQGKRGAYNIPNFGDLVYCGIYGCLNALDVARRMEDNGKSHPFVVHLKQGSWYIDYCTERLADYTGIGSNGHNKIIQSEMNCIGDIDKQERPLLELAEWIKRQYNLINKVANISLEYIITYIDAIFSSIYRYILYYILNNDKKDIFDQLDPKTVTELLIKHDPLYIHLLLATYQMYSYVPSSPLIWRSKIPSISAGLPHFSTGFMRSWGRDTFIAFKGILLSSKRYIEAKQEILGIARLMRNGLIPNLIDSGNSPRYNARDATWFFTNAVMEYCRLAPNGHEIMNETVLLRYPISVSEILSLNQKYAFEWLIGKSDINATIKEVRLSDIIHFILTRHVNGIKFREENAGPKLDEQMKDLGFNVEISWERETGFVYGGSIHNCGTWMDKMGSSYKASNKGVPATPRDGADIEIIALLYSTISQITLLEKDRKFPYSGVKYSKSEFISYSDWVKLIKDNIEYSFYIPSKGEIEGNDKYKIEKKFLNKTEIYKDTFGSSHGWTDYQLRCNFVVALGVAVDLFDMEHSSKALTSAENYLFTPNMLGIKTLDPSDYNYRPNYDNSNDSEDYHVAHGFNYHQGPEWVWPLGYFLSAKYEILVEKNKKLGFEVSRKIAIYETMKHLVNHREYIRYNQWGSLPELTNDNGSFCKDSCFSQAWSVGTILSFLTCIQGVNNRRYLNIIGYSSIRIRRQDIMSIVRINKDESIDEIVRFYEKVIQTQKKTNQSLLNENIRLRAKIRNNYARSNEEILNGNFLFATPPPNLSQIRRVKFQPKLSPIAQSPGSERVPKHSAERVQTKDLRSVYVQTEHIEFEKENENKQESGFETEEPKKGTGKLREKKQIFKINLTDKIAENKGNSQNTSAEGVESGEMKENVNLENNLINNMKKKYPLRENSRCVSYKTIIHLRHMTTLMQK